MLPDVQEIARAVAAHLACTPMMPPKRILNSEEASRYLGVTPDALKLWRKEKRGPRYKYIGNRAIYAVQDLEDWWDSLPEGSDKSACVKTRMEVVQ